VKEKGNRNTQNLKKEARNEDAGTKPNYKYYKLKCNAQYWIFRLTGPHGGGAFCPAAAGGGQDARCRNSVMKVYCRWPPFFCFF